MLSSLPQPIVSPTAVRFAVLSLGEFYGEPCAVGNDRLLPAAAFTEVERTTLSRAMPPNRQGNPRDLAFYMTAITRLDG
jgi:hypothetical protein